LTGCCTGDPFVTAFAVAVGLIFGSFATVAAHRIPRRENIVSGRSHCPHCGRMIRAWENVPVVSYVALRGRCAGCEARISPRYPLIELATGVLFGISAWRFGLSLTAVLYAAFFWVLVVLTVIDLDHKLLPNRVVYPAFIVGWIGIIIDALLTDSVAALARAALGAAVFGGLLFLIAFIVPAGMGMGDVKLAGVLGTFLGYLGGLSLVLAGMFLSFVAGGVIGTIVMVVTGGSRKMQVPFGPFLAAGTVAAIVFGRRLVDSYLGMF